MKISHKSFFIQKKNVKRVKLSIGHATLEMRFIMVTVSFAFPALPAKWIKKRFVIINRELYQTIVYPNSLKVTLKKHLHLKIFDFG